MRSKKVQHPLELMRVKAVIGVEERDQIGSCRKNSSVPCSVAAAARDLAQENDSTITSGETGDQRGSTVFRAVIDDDQFEFGAALGKNALDGSGNRFSCII